MSRNSNKPASPAEAPEFKPDVPERMDAAQDLTAALQKSYAGERDLVNQLLGQAQAFHAAGNLLQTFGVSKLAYVKEHRLYQALAGQKTPNGLELRGTWEEFCELLGMSDEKANQDIANLRAFGEDALESMSRMGIGYRELRQYRRLPADEKQALIEMAQTGDKEGFVELAEEIIARSTKKTEALAQQVQELQADHAAAAELMQKKNERIDRLEREKNRIEHAPAEERIAADMQELTTRCLGAVGYVRGDVRLAFRHMFDLEQAGEAPAGAHRRVMAGWVRELENELQVLKSEFFLNDVEPLDVRAEQDARINATQTA